MKKVALKALTFCIVFSIFLVAGATLFKIERYLTVESIQFKLQMYEGGSQRLAGLYMLEQALGRQYAQGDFIYLLENDYLHDYDWIYFVNQLITSDVPFDYISLYDHADKYPFRQGFHEMHKNLFSKIYVAGDRHWRTVPSTCYSFIVSAKKFKEDIGILESDLMDHQMFAELENKGRILLSPIPGLATHCMTNLLSPSIDWETFLRPLPDAEYGVKKI